MKLQFWNKYLYIRRQSRRKKEHDDFKTENFNWEFLGLYIGIGEERYEANASEKGINDGDIDSYVEKRWAGQRKFFSKKSVEAKKKFIRNQVAIIVLSALTVTVLTVNFDDLFGEEISEKVKAEVIEKVKEKDSAKDVDANNVKAFVVDGAKVTDVDSTKESDADSTKVSDTKVDEQKGDKEKIVAEIIATIQNELPKVKTPNRLFNNRIICAILSLLIIIISGIDKLKQHHEEWTRNRNAAELLKSEICRYKFGVGPYFEPEKTEEPEQTDNPEDPDAIAKGRGPLPPAPLPPQSSIVNKATAMVCIVVPPENSPEKTEEPEQEPSNPDGLAEAPSIPNNDSVQQENMENMDNNQPGSSAEEQPKSETSEEQSTAETAPESEPDKKEVASEPDVVLPDPQANPDGNSSDAKADEVKEEKTDNQHSDEEYNRRINELFNFLNNIIKGKGYGKFKFYKEIKRGLANYVWGVKPNTNDGNDVQANPFVITKKEVLFVKRINEIIEVDKHWLRRHNYYRDIKDEMTDFCTNSGVYAVFAKSDDSKSSSKSATKSGERKQITKQDRMFVDHVETIISNDVKQFISQKSQLADFEDKYGSYVDMHYEKLGKQLNRPKDDKKGKKEDEK